MNKNKWGICLLLSLAVLTAGCGKTAKQEPVQQTESVESSEVSTETTVETAGSGTESDRTVETVETAENVETEAENHTDTGETLAKRLCGKYSCPRDGEEYLILDLFEFGNNLYGYMGEAFGDEGELMAYSFWAVEFFPEEATALTSTVSDECTVYAMSFSIMANLSKYQAAPQECRIKLVPEGIELSGPFISAGEDPVLFSSDDRVEDPFPYVDSAKEGAGEAPAKLTGLWKERVGDAPIYLEFDGNGKLRIWRESPGTEVLYACGCYYGIEKEGFGTRFNSLGNGTMPEELGALCGYRGNNGLEIVVSYADMSFWDTGESYTFDRVDPSQIPVVTLGEVMEALGEDHVYDMYSVE